MPDRKPRAPTGLGTRGRRFWSSTVADYSLSTSELEVLVEVCRTIDVCERLEEAVAGEGVTVAGSKGQPRPNPALGELRQQRLSLERLLAALALPDPDAATVPSPATLRARKAANSRWARHEPRSARGTV